MATSPLYFPSALKALSPPRIQIPDSGQSRALEAGLGAGVSALSKVAEIWRDRENFQAQSEQMAQALEREGMTQEAGMYRSAAQSATTNFFTDPATNRKAQQGLLSDALKLLQNKQQVDLERELAANRIQAGYGMEHLRLQADVDKEGRAEDRARESVNTWIDMRNQTRAEGEEELDKLGPGTTPPPLTTLPDLDEDPLAKERIENTRDRLAFDKDKFEYSKKLQDQAQTRSKQFEVEIAEEKERGLTVTPYTSARYGGVITGYVSKNLNGQEVTRKGVRVITEREDGAWEVEDLETRTTVPRTQAPVGPSSPLLPGEYLRPPTRANENPLLPPPIQDSGF